MLLREHVAVSGEFVSPLGFSTVSRHLPESWIDEALQATGVTTLRRRRLPMQQAVWLTLGIALLRDRSIVSVAESLEVLLPGPTDFVASSALSQARQRLGDAPLEKLFRLCANRWSSDGAEHQWRGLRLLVMDGVVWRTPDTVENRAAFGGQNSVGDKASPFPQLRAVCLLAARSRQIVDATFDAYSVGETTLAKRLLPSIPKESLVLVDKGYFSADLLLSISQSGNHWLIPMKPKCRHDVETQLAKNDALWRLPVSPQARKKNPSLPEHYIVRAVTGSLPNGSDVTVLTSLTDHKRWPAKEVFELYRERWEIEIAYREIKTELLEAAMTLRSQTPTGIAQELWATLLMYNLVRLEIMHIADEAKVEPLRISFVMALRYILDEWLWSSNSPPGAIPKKLQAMRRNIKRFVLPPRRTHRSFPRVVVAPKSKFPKKNKNAAQLA